MRRITLAALGSAGLFAHVSVGMYADDAGKLDWHRENLGRLVSAGFDGRGGLTVVGEESTLASIDTSTGALAWRRVLAPDDTIFAISTPAAGRSTATLSSGGRVVRLWSPVDGSLLWETALAPEAGLMKGSSGSGGAGDGGETEAMLPRVVSTEWGHVVVLSAGGIHVLSAASGSVLAQWWCDPAREPDLAALVGVDMQVTFTSLRLGVGGGASLVAGGWAAAKGVSDKAQAFVVAEIDPVERLVTFKTATVSKCKVNPSRGVTLTTTAGASGAPSGIAVVGLCSTGTSLAAFDPALEAASSVAEIPLPKGLLADPATTVASLSNLAGSNGSLLELRGVNGGGSAAVSLASGGGSGGGSGAVSVVKGSDQTRVVWSCPPAAGGAGSSEEGSCALAGGVTPSGKTVVASAAMRKLTRGVESGGEQEGTLVIRVAEIGEQGAVLGSIETGTGLSGSPGQGRPRRVEAAFLEAGDIGGCEGAGGAKEMCFRVLLVNEDDSAMMVGRNGVDWVREEALASVDQVVFVNSAEDEMAMLAASGHKVEHHIPDWKERMQLQRLEIMNYLGRAVKSLTGMMLMGGEVLEGAGPSEAAFGLKKLAVCSTRAGKIYAIDMADGSIAWSLLLPAWATDAKIVLHATRPKSTLGLHPEVAVIALGETSTLVSWRDAITGAETMSEEFAYKVASAVPLDVKDAEDRSVVMLVDGDGRVHAAPSSPESTHALSELLPSLYYHDFSAEKGLASFAVVKEVGGQEETRTSEKGGELSSAPVASVPMSAHARLVAKAYPDRRDAVQTPAHTLGDDSLLIKYINPRLMAFATLAEPTGLEEESGKGQEMAVTVLDNVSGRILHRISHKGVAEPIHMVVSESWVVYSYWSAASQRTEMSTLSLYEGMIDKYGLSPFNRPEWKEAFSSFESRVPIVLQKTFVFPGPVTALGITVTQRGITSKDVLVGTAHGQVILLDRRFLDPRRPQEEPTKEEKEEKLVQYQAYLPMIPTQVLSYYKSVERVNRVLTEPTGLESTSLVLALGLDLFGCRVAPSKTYDMLDPNFNYALLALVLLAMSVAVYISVKMAASKRLKDQWT